MTAAAKPSYRPEIDGLRAVAVLSIVVFHFDEQWLPGGFAGVDIFFVISGFLITSIVASDVRAARFSLATFYGRRIKRIMPALTVTVLAALVVGQLILIPRDFVELAKSAIAAMFSAANVFFVYAVDTGYFADSSATRPLLHTWSLGVEEHFYLLWPMALATLVRRVPGPLLVRTSVALTVAALVLSEVLVWNYPTFAYYMLPSRAFELLIGATLALAGPSFNPGRRLAEALCIVGIALIASSLLFVGPELPFPGIFALPATLGTALVIAGAEGGTLVGKLLRYRVLVWIGLISYSLYLWHWPILAYMRYAYIDITLLSGSLALVGMFALAAATFRFVETPFRKSALTFRWVVTRLLVVPGAVVALLGTLVVASSGLGIDSFFPNYAARIEAAAESVLSADKYPYTCQRFQLTKADIENPDCIINGDTEPKALLWGDSNAAHYVGLLAALAEAQEFSFRSLSHSSCPPILNEAYRYSFGLYVNACKASHRILLPVLDKYDTLILSAQWASYETRGFWDDLVLTVRTLTASGKNVLILGQVPRFPRFDRNCSAKAIKLPFLDCLELSVIPRDAAADIFSVNARLKALAEAEPGAAYRDFNDLICPGERCLAYRGAAALYFDGGHLSIPGSWILGHEAVEAGLELPIPPSWKPGTRQ